MIPDEKIVCLNCCSAKAAEGLWEHQRAYLQRVDAGDWELRLIKAGPNLHIQMFGHGAENRVFCGADLQHLHLKRSRGPYNIEQLAKCCPDCRNAIVRAMEEARNAA
jgi:hypothetical protein